MNRHILRCALVIGIGFTGVTCTRTPTQSDQAESGRQWLAGDHHIHTRFSVGWDYTSDPPTPQIGGGAIYPIPMNALMGKYYGLGWMVNTDHGGPLHSKVNLMEELAKVRRVAGRDPGDVREVLLVIDATTGQNGLSQAKQFAESVDVTGVVLTKLDGSAKGGIVFAIQQEMNLPVKLVGLGGSAEDLVDFDPDEFVDALVSVD